MKIIDAYTGRRVRVGDTFPAPFPPLPTGEEITTTLLSVDDRFFTASAVLRLNPSGRVVATPLHVRFTHPGYLFQRVLFIPS